MLRSASTAPARRHGTSPQPTQQRFPIPINRFRGTGGFSTTRIVCWHTQTVYCLRLRQTVFRQNKTLHLQTVQRFGLAGRYTSTTIVFPAPKQHRAHKLPQKKRRPLSKQRQQNPALSGKRILNLNSKNMKQLLILFLFSAAFLLGSAIEATAPRYFEEIGRASC